MSDVARALHEAAFSHALLTVEMNDGSVYGGAFVKNVVHEPDGQATVTIKRGSTAITIHSADVREVRAAETVRWHQGAVPRRKRNRSEDTNGKTPPESPFEGAQAGF